MLSQSRIEFDDNSSSATRRNHTGELSVKPGASTPSGEVWQGLAQDIWSGNQNHTPKPAYLVAFNDGDDSKHEEKDPQSAKPADAKPADAKPAEVKPAAPKPLDASPAADKGPDSPSLSDQINSMPSEIQPGLKRLMAMAEKNPERAKELERLVSDLIKLERSGKLTKEMRFYLEKDGVGFLKGGGVSLLKSLVSDALPKPAVPKPEAPKREPLKPEELKAKTDHAFAEAKQDIELYEQTGMVSAAKRYTNEVLSKYFPGVEPVEVFAGNEGLAIKLSDGSVLKFRPNTEWDSNWGTRDLDMPLLSIDGGEARPMLIGPEGEQWVVYRQPFGERPDPKQVEQFIKQVKRIRGDTGDFGKAVDAAGRQLGKYRNPNTGRTEVRCFDYGALEIEVGENYEFTEADVLDVPSSKKAPERGGTTGGGAEDALRIETGPFESLPARGEPKVERPVAAMEAGKMIEIKMPGGIVARVAKADAPALVEKLEREFKTEDMAKFFDEASKDTTRSEKEREQFRNMKERWETLDAAAREECKAEFFQQLRTELGIETGERSPADQARSGRVMRCLGIAGAAFGLSILSAALLRHCLSKAPANHFARVNVQFVKSK